LQREVSEQLRARYRAEAVAITISDVETSTDLRNATIFYSVLGEEVAVKEAKALFRKIGKDLHQRVRQEITLKFFPKFEFVYDTSLARGAEILKILEGLDEPAGEEETIDKPKE